MELFLLVSLGVLPLQIDAWAQSNSIPGQFTGSTGAQILSSDELTNSGPQAWIRKVEVTQTLLSLQHTSQQPRIAKLQDKWLTLWQSVCPVQQAGLRPCPSVSLRL